jgi:hypothetical protein
MVSYDNIMCYYGYAYGKYWWLKDSVNKDVAYVYPHNLREVFPDPYCNIDLAASLTDCKQPVIFTRLLKNLKAVPQTEYMVKMGLQRLASEISAEHFEENNPRNLGISRQYVPMYREFNVSLREHEIIKASRSWVSRENFGRLRALKVKNDDAYLVCELLQVMSFERFVNYFVKQRNIHRTAKIRELLVWYRDYKQMAVDMKIDLSRKALLFPADIKEAHDTIMAEYKAEETAIENEKLRNAHERLYGGLQAFSKGIFAIVFPESKDDFVREGKSLSHCVGTSSHYFTDHLKGEVMVFFIRKAEDIGTPFVTMSVNMKKLTISQIYGYGETSQTHSLRNYQKPRKGGRVKL